MDIVERLRNCEESSMGGEGIFKLNYKILTEAADEIERLREALKYARRFLNAKDHDVVFIDSALQQKESE